MDTTGGLQAIYAFARSFADFLKNRKHTHKKAIDIKNGYRLYNIFALGVLAITIKDSLYFLNLKIIISL